MSFVVGCKVKLSSSCREHGILKTGQVGVLIEVDGSSVPFKVEFEGKTYWYPRSVLELADARVEAVAPALLPLTPQVPSCSVDEPLTLSHDSGFDFSNPSTSETDVEFPCGPVNLFSNIVVGMAASTSARFSFIPRGGNSAWAVGIIPESRQSDEDVIWESPIGWHRGGSGVRNASMSSEFRRAESQSLICTVAVDSTRLELTLEIAGTVVGKQALQPSMFPLRLGICGHSGTKVRAVGGGATIPVLPAAKDNCVSHKGFLYRALADGWDPNSSDKKDQSGNTHPLPAGFNIAPDEPDCREVVGMFNWSTNEMALGSSGQCYWTARKRQVENSRDSDETPGSRSKKVTVEQRGSSYFIQSGGFAGILVRRAEGTPVSLKFAVAECSAVVKQQLSLPGLVIEPSDAASAGTIVFQSGNDRVAKLDGSNITAQAVGTATLTAVFSPSAGSKFMRSEASIQLNVTKIKVSLTVDRAKSSLTVPLRAFLPLESVPLPTVMPEVLGAWKFFGKSSNVGIKDGLGVFGLNVADSDELVATFIPTESDVYESATASIPVCVKFLQQQHDREGDLVKVHDFFNNTGAFEGSSDIPFPDLDFTKLCPQYFQNVITALSSPPQVPHVAQQLHLQRLVANARLPLECKISKENGSCQFALDIYLRRAVDMLGEHAPSASDLRALENWITSCGVDVKRRDSFRRNALHSLAVCGSASSIVFAEMLIRIGSSSQEGGLQQQDLIVLDDDDDGHDGIIESKDHAGFTALDIAVDQGNVNFAAMLVSKGAQHRQDFLKSRYDPRDSEGSKRKWLPVVDAVIRAKQQCLQDQSLFMSSFISGTVLFDRRTHQLEGDSDVFDIVQGNFKPFSPPSLKNVQAQDPAFAKLLHTLALTRFPRHCDLVVEAKRGLSAYVKLLKGEVTDDSTPSEHLSDTPVSDPGFPLARSASGNTAIPLHRWALAIAAHIAHCEQNFSVSKSLLMRLQDYEPGAQLSPCEQRLAISSHNSLRSDENDVRSELFGKHDPISTKFDDVTRGYDAQQLEPLNTLMGYIGIQSVKQLSLDMYSIAKDRERLRKDGREKSIVEPRLNFAFAGNPGCGKTESARLFSKILVKSGLRPDNFIEMTAQQAIQMGENAFCDVIKKSNLAAPKSKSDESPGAPDLPSGKFLKKEAVEVQLASGGEYVRATIIDVPESKVQGLPDSSKYDVRLEDGREIGVEPSKIRRFKKATQPPGGVLFIDEAYVLDPSHNPAGRSIFNEVMRIAEDHRDTVTVILSGYRSEIEQNLFSYNPGMSSRFDVIVFDDFTEQELECIWKKICKDKGFLVHDKVSSVVRRRLSKQRGREGFSNARAVRTLFEKASLPATHRYRVDNDVIDSKPPAEPPLKRPQLEIIVEDVIGERPNRDTHPKLNAILGEVDALVGVPDVKKAMYSLVDTMLRNWDREKSALPTEGIFLNRVFVGNPGTGKTTVAKLYAGLLCATGMLSKDEVMVRSASDFMGQAVGESAQKTKDILKLAEGKALLIDEAYALFDGASKSSGNASYGQQVLDTIVEKVAGEPEDRAIIMAGYEHQILEMFRGSNPGLSSRFDADFPWRFADFSDDDLLEVAVAYVRSPKRDLSALVRTDVIRHMVQKVSKQRALHNFGNARAIETTILKAKERQTIRLRDAQAGKPVAKTKRITIEDVDGYTDEERRHFENPMSILEGLEGLGDFKSKMQQLMLNLAEKRAQGRPVGELLSNWIFLGRPGTGKTTVARKMAKLMNALGLLATHRIVETSALDLTGEYVGQSKKKVQEAMDAARGGVLFIDEAYALGGEDKYCKDAQDTLVQLMTDVRYKGSTIVIIAGYKDEMEDMCRRNPGFSGRFQSTQRFEDWSDQELADLVISKLEKGAPPDRPYALDNKAAIRSSLEKAFCMLRTRNPDAFSNARDAELMYALLVQEYTSRCGRERVSKGDGMSDTAVTDDDAAAAAQRCLDGRASQPIADFKKLSKRAFDSATQVAQQRFSTPSNTNAAVNEKVNNSKFERATEVEEVAEKQFVDEQAALIKFLDEHNNDPAVGMAMEEAVDAKLLSEEEAREILGRGADGLNWSEMLLDAARNSKLQEFLKSNRWMKRQGFVDFEAKLKDLAQQHRSDLSALEKGIRDLEEEHLKAADSVHKQQLQQRITEQREVERKKKEEARIKEETARKQAEEKMQQQMRESMRRRQRHVQKMDEAGIEICPICNLPEREARGIGCPWNFS